MVFIDLQSSFPKRNSLVRLTNKPQGELMNICIFHKFTKSRCNLSNGWNIKTSQSWGTVCFWQPSLGKPSPRGWGATGAAEFSGSGSESRALVRFLFFNRHMTVRSEDFLLPSEADSYPVSTEKVGFGEKKTDGSAVKRDALPPECLSVQGPNSLSLALDLLPQKQIISGTKNLWTCSRPSINRWHRTRYESDFFC